MNDNIGRNNPYRAMNRGTSSTTRPSSSSTTTAGAGAGAGASSSQQQVPKRYVLTPPKQLRAYFESKPEVGYPDFFPWTGHQLEDVLNARTIRNGFQEPPLFTTWQVQPSSQGLCTLLKRPDAINALSSFLNAAYHKRCQLGRLPANTTFKPLPRVTLTEQKREAWLRDLANIHIPLKKLSRTIPHGIKDRSLIDQCCIKNIPIHRAVWLSRCVGANELRSLRRKGGTSNSGGSAATTDLENRWVKAWTLQIASYIEDTIEEARPNTGTAGTDNSFTSSNSNNSTLKPSPIRPRSTPSPSEWIRKLNYLLWLCAELYFEGLVDRDLLVVWSIEFLNNCKPCAVLVGLEFVKLFWIPITQNLRLSKWLFQVLINQINNVKSSLPSETTNNSDASSTLDITALYSTITTSLTVSLQGLFQDCPDAFVVPWQWTSIFKVLVTCPDLARNIVGNPQFKSISMRNQEFATFSGSNSVNSTTNQQYLYDSLDTLYGYVDPQQTVTQCLASGCSTSEILSLVFSMAIANDRYGNQHVDIAITVSQYWGSNEITSAIMTILADPELPQKASIDKLCRLLNGLTLANSIHLNRYIRLLISRNILRSCNLQLVQLHTKVLSNVNFGTENRLLFNQQKLLLATVGEYSEDTQNENYKTAKRNLLQYLFVWLGDGEEEQENVVDASDRVKLESSLGLLVGTLRQKLIDWVYNRCMGKVIKTCSDLSWINPDSLCLVLDLFKWTGNIQGSISIITALITLKNNNNNNNLANLIPSISMFIYTNLTSFSVFCNVQVLVTRILECHRSNSSGLSSSRILQLLVSSIFASPSGVEQQQQQQQQSLSPFAQKQSIMDMQTPASIEGASGTTNNNDSTKLGYVNQILGLGETKPPLDVYFKAAIDKLVSAKDGSTINEMIKVFQILTDVNPMRIGQLLENWLCLQHDPAWSITHQEHTNNSDDQHEQSTPEQQQQQQTANSYPSSNTTTLLGSDSLRRDELLQLLALLIAHNCWPIEKVVSAYLKIGQRAASSVATPGVGGTSCDLTFVIMDLLCDGGAASANLSPSDRLSLMTQVDILRSNCPKLYLKFIFTCLDMLVSQRKSQQEDNNNHIGEFDAYFEKFSNALKWAISNCFHLLILEIDQFVGSGEYWQMTLVEMLKKSINCGDELCDYAKHINHTSSARLIQLYIRLQVEFGMLTLDSNLILKLISQNLSANQLSNLFVSLPAASIVKLSNIILEMFMKSKNFPAVYRDDVQYQGSNNKRPLDTDDAKQKDNTRNNNLVPYLISIIQVCCSSCQPAVVRCPIPKELQDPKGCLESLVNMVRNIDLLDSCNQQQQVVDNLKMAVILMVKFISFYYCLSTNESSLDQRLRLYHGFVSSLCRTELIKSDNQLRQTMLDGSSCLLDLPIQMANPPKSLVDLAGISLALSGHEIPTGAARGKDGSIVTAGTGTVKPSTGPRLTSTATVGTSPSKSCTTSTSTNTTGSNTGIVVPSCLAACLINIQLPTTTIPSKKPPPQDDIMYKFYSETPMTGMMLYKRQQQQQHPQQQTAAAAAATTPPRPRSAGPDLPTTTSESNNSDGNGSGAESTTTATAAGAGAQQHSGKQESQLPPPPPPPPIIYTTPSLLNIKPVDLLEDFNIAPTCDNDVALSLSLFDAVKWV